MVESSRDMDACAGSCTDDLDPDFKSQMNKCLSENKPVSLSPINIGQ